MIERYGHGGDVWTAAEMYGIDKNRFLDFSSNMNPLGPPAAVGRIIREEWERELVRYPDPTCRELHAKIASTYGIPASSILAGNGAAELIDLAVRALKPRRVGLLRPCFSEYEEAAEKAGANIVDVPLSEELGFLPDPESEELQRMAEEGDLLFLGHPNNPTGRLLPPAYIEKLLSAGCRLILDEAFIDFSGDEESYSFIRKAPHSDRLFVVRSMTKFYSIPGLRLGFIVAHPEWITAMKKLQVHWSVNGLAQRVGTEVLGDRSFERDTLEWLQRERAWLTGKLAGVGLTVTPSDTNYLLFALPRQAPYSIRELQATMGKREILIRDASTFRGLDTRYGRVAVRLREQNERLIGGLASSLEQLNQNG